MTGIMPPKSALFQGTEPTEAPKYNGPYPPVMTAHEKVKDLADEANREKNVPREALSSPACSSSSKSKSNPKPKSLPPPGEAALLAKEEGRASRRKKGWNSEKPMTSQQEYAAAKANATAKNAFGIAVKEAKAKEQEKKEIKQQKGGKGRGKERTALGEYVANAGAKASTNTAKNIGTGEGGGKVERVPEVKLPGAVTIVHAQHATALQFQKPERKRNEVLYRRTAKATALAKKRFNSALKNPAAAKLWSDTEIQFFKTGFKKHTSKALQDLAKDGVLRGKLATLFDAGVLPAPGEVELGAVELYGQAATFRFMDLPKEVRAMTYDLAVVETKAFVNPALPHNREQPDVAMVSRQVRAEVLPIFYSRNTFAIELAPSFQLRKANPGSISYRRSVPSLLTIEPWAQALESGGQFQHIRNWVFDYAPLSSRYDDEDSSILLSIRFNKTQSAKGQASEYWEAKVEVHHEASCIAPELDGHGSCVLRNAPEWVNELVIGVCEKAKGGAVTAEMIMELAKAVREKVAGLVGSRCEMAEVRVARLCRSGY